MAARDRRDAEAFAAEHAIPVVHDSYEALIADPGIDAVYNPLPNSPRAQNFIHPHVRHRVTVLRGGQAEVVSSPPGEAQGTTYLYQLRAFAAAVRSGAPFPSTPEHAVATMRLIDDVYRAAGLPPRGMPA